MREITLPPAKYGDSDNTLLLKWAMMAQGGSVLVPTTLIFSTQPGGAVVDEPFTTQPVVTVKDQNGATLTTFTGDVTIAKLSGSGTLSGDTTVAAVAGVATFVDLELSAADDYVLRASIASPALSVDSDAFEVEADVDPDAQAFFDRVVTNGGAISVATQGYVNTFVLAAKANGYWTKLLRVNLFCGDDLPACLTPLKVGGGNDPEDNQNFVGGDYSEATGLTGNGTTKYLDTGIAGTDLTTNSTHLSAYNRSSTGGFWIGCDDGTNFIWLMGPDATGPAFSWLYNNNGLQGQVVSPGSIGTPYGFLVGSRTASNAHSILRNGSSLALSSTTGGSLIADNLFVFAVNRNPGGAAFFSANVIGSYSIGLGLSDAEVALFNTDLEAFQVSLGRGVQ